MNFPSHLSFGVFTALIFYYATQDWVLAFVVLLIQVMLILDFLFKKLMAFEPLHTVIACLAAWGISYFFFPAYHVGVAFAYFSHLCLDLFVEEEIPLFYPFSFLPAYPMKHSEKVVQVTSWAGSALMLLFILYI